MIVVDGNDNNARNANSVTPFDSKREVGLIQTNIFSREQLHQTTLVGFVGTLLAYFDEKFLILLPSSSRS